jgi:hypothetical protein
MSFNVFEYLKAGKVDFVFRLTNYDFERLIENIRKSDTKEEIIDGFLPILKDTKPLFCFLVIYDMEAYADTLQYLLEKPEKYPFTVELFKGFIRGTSVGRNFVLTYLDDFMMKGPEYYEEILAYTFSDFEKNKDFVDKLYLHKNLHARFLFMKQLLLNYPEKVKELYGNIIDYLTSYTHQEYEQLTFLPERMRAEDVSSLAMLFYQNNNKEMWLKFKDYILNNYETNDLAKHLLSNNQLEEFQKDAKCLFDTSRNFKLQIYTYYAKQISDELLQDSLETYYEKIKYFKKDTKLDPHLFKITSYGLGKKLEDYVDKYLSLSKDSTYEYIANGSTSSCYRIGDYAFKLDTMKWSYEDTICPNLYLILKNLEEVFIRDEQGIVLAGLEVQKFLKRSANYLPEEVYDFFHEELEKMGYYITDSLFNNCRLLDCYQDADTDYPSRLPEIFKEYPIVLVDRDRIYQKDKWPIKQLRSTY